eukprot:TRINITY_DN796_c0_g1_i4.p1 TRINITY_DN796_c0_g1~~TRINITY_DN796_c0_g1_i4.p1  ORF type:complete len:144 (+),score=19.40 TRINITY_DN796_c0_g1_i4:308-739(+)
MSAAIASASCAAAATCVVQSSLVNHGQRLRASKTAPALGLPVLSRSLKAERVVCSAAKPEEAKSNLAGLAASMTAISTIAATHPAMALVDERLSTEGTGLALGLSDTSLTWVLVGVFGLVWAVFFTFSAGLPDNKDSDSGLSL